MCVCVRACVLCVCGGGGGGMGWGDYVEFFLKLFQLFLSLTNCLISSDLDSIRAPMAHKEPASFCVLENHWSSQDQKPSLTIFNQILTSALEQVSENNTDINQNTLKNSKRKITGKCLRKSLEENKSQTSKTSQLNETQEQNSISDGLANLSCRTVVPVNLHLQRKFHYTRFGKC